MVGNTKLFYKDVGTYMYESLTSFIIFGIPPVQEYTAHFVWESICHILS